MEFNPSRYYLLECSRKQSIADLKYGRVNCLRLRNQSLQDMIDLSYGLGTPFNVHEKNRSKSLIRKVTPAKDHAHEESANGNVYLSYHTENLSHLKPPNFVALFCERKDRNNQGYTLLSTIDDIKELLTESEIEILSSDKFTVYIEDSLNIDGIKAALPTKVPVFRDNKMFFDNLFMVPDADAVDAFEKLKQIIIQVEMKILLEPGDLLIFNNFTCVHGRSEFHPKFDGQDRCLHRLLILDEFNTSSPVIEFEKYPVVMNNNILETNNQLTMNLAKKSLNNTEIFIQKMKKVCIFEVEGGFDKHHAPHRREIVLIKDALKARNIYSEVVFYKDEDAYIYDYVASNFDFCLVRINPEFYPSYTKSKFFKLLTKFESKIICLPTANSIVNLDSKSIIYYIRNTLFGMADTNLYTNINDFKKNFQCYEQRVIKADHNAEGRGVFLVSNHLEEEPEIKTNRKSHYLRIIEAATNKEEIMTKENFAKVLFKENSQILDQKYLQKIKEMEIRIMLIEKKIIWIIVFIPKSEEWLANGDGIYYEPSKWPNLCKQMTNWLPQLEKYLQTKNCKLPFLWSADFIMQDDDHHYDSSQDICEYADKAQFVLSEINCSCLGFRQNSSQPNVALDIAEAIFNMSTVI
ncbi:hypothetical protein I4U23_027225 [Adineta vaga]|nr:hypothetical protein I4U23_027225 [Adineta vaga]